MKSTNQASKNCEYCPSKDKGIFCELQQKALADIDHHKVTNTYKKGQIIFHQGNPPFGLYCVQNGKIKLSRTGSDGKESIIRLATSGDVLGHRSLFNDEVYSATAKVMEDTTICFLDRTFILDALKKEPSIALQIIQKLSRDMGVAEARSASLVQKNVSERLAEFLLNMKSNYGLKQPDGRIKLDIKLTREEIASMVGTASETIIRCISDFKEQGIIEQEEKAIFICDEKALSELANINF